MNVDAEFRVFDYSIGEGTMRKGVLTAIGLAVATVGMVAVPVVSAGASSSTQGVTATTIRVGVPYTDFAPVRALGIDINYGNQAHGYEALFAYTNAHGGINGRKIVPYIVGVNPVGNAASQTACTQLTQDDKVFVSISPVVPGCYLLAHVPTINASYPGTVPAGAAQNLSFTPPTTRYDPVQLAIFKKMGAFKGKKVGLYAEPGDASRDDCRAVDSQETGCRCRPDGSQLCPEQRRGRHGPAGHRHQPALQERWREPRRGRRFGGDVEHRIG